MIAGGSPQAVWVQLLTENLYMGLVSVILEAAGEAAAEAPRPLPAL